MAGRSFGCIIKPTTSRLKLPELLRRGQGDAVSVAILHMYKTDPKAKCLLSIKADISASQSPTVRSLDKISPRVLILLGGGGEIRREKVKEMALEEEILTVSPVVREAAPAIRGGGRGRSFHGSTVQTQ